MDTDLSLLLWFMFVLATICPMPHAVHSITVHTSKGRVKGMTRSVNGKKVDIFYGIPYAKPPLGELRFAYPEPPDVWSDVRNATQPPNCCMQVPDLMFGDFPGANIWNPNSPVSEDCLYLNVWTPRTNPPYSNKAVMVWIYGGSFSSGSSTLDIYDGQILAAENDVVVVSMQYRFGALGFFVLGSNDAPGNAGMMDLVMALQWVQTNIHYFGGNAHNVTLMGESSGAVSVGLLMLSSLSRELFHRAILQSGAPQAHWGTYTVAEGRRRSLALAKKLHCNDHASDADIIKCLREKPAIVFPQNEYNSITNGIGQFPFLPAIDGRFLRMSPSDYLKEGSFKKAPIIIGSNANEGTWLLVYSEQELFSISNESLIGRLQYYKVMDSIFRYYPQYPIELNKEAKDAIKDKYTDWIDPDDQVRLRGQVEKAVGDHFFTCSAAAFAKAMSRAGQDVFFYRFSHRMVNHDWPAWMGVLHGDEIFFVFGSPLKNRTRFTQEEEILSRKMMKFWTNFAKTGNPNRGPFELGLNEWPKFKHNEQLYLNLSTDLRNSNTSWGQGVRAEYCGFLDNYIPSLAKSEPLSFSANCSMTAASTSGAGSNTPVWTGLTINLALLSSNGHLLCPVFLAMVGPLLKLFIPAQT